MLPLTSPDRWRLVKATRNSTSVKCNASFLSLRQPTVSARSLRASQPSALPSPQPLSPIVGFRAPRQGLYYSIHRGQTILTNASASGTEPAGGRLQKVIDGLDELNSKDPRSVEVDGQPVPYELAYARWLSAWMERLCGDAGREPSEELRIAARGQHVERWKVPRSSYPEGRTAYLQWREDLKRQHAATTTGLMAAAGYPPESCKRVEQLILKKALKEPEGQILEDALCLVFLERQFAEFLPKLAEGAGGDQAEAEAKMVDILQKSWKKMGELGRAAALRLTLEPRLAELVGRALA